MSDEPRFRKVPGSDAEVHIQWKGTDVCLDFHCPCRPANEMFSSHLDGMFAYYVRCMNCGDVYELGTQVLARRISVDEAAALANPPLEME